LCLSSVVEWVLADDIDDKRVYRMSAVLGLGIGDTY
jgi:hypothetical protein